MAAFKYEPITPAVNLQKGTCLSSWEVGDSGLSCESRGCWDWTLAHFERRNISSHQRSSRPLSSETRSLLALKAASSPVSQNTRRSPGSPRVSLWFATQAAMHVNRRVVCVRECVCERETGNYSVCPLILSS